LAITALEFVVFNSLRAQSIIPPKPRVLELGHSNWYCDVPLEQLAQAVRQHVADPVQRDELLDKLGKMLVTGLNDHLYELASIFWRVFVDPGSYTAIDPASDCQYHFDLNLPVPLQDRFDLTVNIGTAEHVFNVYQFFKTAHERTIERGIIMHSSPFTGWPDHGFYNFQPTFFYDLARANGYEILFTIIGQIEPLKFVAVESHEQIPALFRSGQIPSNSHISVVYRKAAEPREFAVPMQAYYAGVMSPEHEQAWRELRR
jgi:hypothetical protein